MPRTTLTPAVAPGQYPTSGVSAPSAAADVANGNQFVSTGRELLIARNNDAASHTVTIASVPDDHGRTGDITADAIAAGATKIYGPFAKSYWAQSNGFINVNATDTTILFTVVQLP